MITLDQKKRIRKYTNLLKKNCPHDIPIRLYLVDKIIEKGEFFFGDCVSSEISIRIYLSTKVHYQLIIDSLIHEFAHAYCKSEGNHGDLWAKYYGKCYRLVHNEE